MTRESPLPRLLTGAARRARGGLRRGDRLLQQIQARWAPSTPLSDARALLAEFSPEHPAIPTCSSTAAPGVTVLGSLHPGSLFGGTATVMALGASLAEGLDRPLRVVETLSHRTAPDVVAAIRELGVSVDPRRVELVDMSWRRDHEVAPLPLHPRELVVTSAWWDTAVAARLPLETPVIQLIQDDERIFYPASDEELAVARTFALASTLPVFNTEVLRDHFAHTEFAALARRGISFEPSVLRPPEPHPGTERLLFFYARPQVARNLFALGLEALDRASTDPALAGWTLVMAGDAELPDLTLDGGQRLTNLGKLGLREYQTLIGRAAVALSPMLAPHPNYPTLEVAQAGARVVTTAWGRKTDLSRYGEVTVAPARVGALRDALVAACARHDAGVPVTSGAALPSTWPEAFAPVLARVREVIS